MTDRIVHRSRYTATFTGKGEFYSGISHGERVLLTVETTVYWFDGKQRSSSHLSVQRLDGNSPHLSVRLDEVADVRRAEIVEAAA